METKRNLTVVIPAYNEAASIASVIENIRAECADIVDEIIVVDDGSTDGTGKIAEGAGGARVIRHPRNRGYGAALKTGIRAARTEFVLTFDADGQYEAPAIRQLMARAGDNDMVSGQRTALMHSPMWRMPGKWMLKFLANMLVKDKIPDLNSGLRLFRTETIRKYVHVCPNGFSFSTTSLMAMLSRGYDVEFVPVNICERRGKSTVSLSTGLETIVLVLRIAALFNPLRLFIPSSFFCILAGVLWEVRCYVVNQMGLSTASLLAIVTGIILFSIGLICDQISQLRLERFE